MQKRADADIHELLARRWSPRAFDAGGALPAGVSEKLAQAARWAPSCFGAEPWSYIFCNRADNPEAWQRLFDCLAEGNKAWAKNCPLLILLASRKHFELNGQANRHYAYDSGAASFALVLQAESLGLRAHQMAGFDAAAASQRFGVPDECACMAVIAVGMQAEASVLEGELRELEEAPRKRKTLAQNFFDGAWQNPLFPDDK